MIDICKFLPFLITIIIFFMFNLIGLRFLIFWIYQNYQSIRRWQLTFSYSIIFVHLKFYKLWSCIWAYRCRKVHAALRYNFQRISRYLVIINYVQLLLIVMQNNENNAEKNNMKLDYDDTVSEIYYVNIIYVGLIKHS